MELAAFGRSIKRAAVTAVEGGYDSIIVYMASCPRCPLFVRLPLIPDRVYEEWPVDADFDTLSNVSGGRVYGRKAE